MNKLIVVYLCKEGCIATLHLNMKMNIFKLESHIFTWINFTNTMLRKKMAIFIGIDYFIDIDH